MCFVSFLRSIFFPTVSCLIFAALLLVFRIVRRRRCFRFLRNDLSYFLTIGSDALHVSLTASNFIPTKQCDVELRKRNKLKDNAASRILQSIFLGDVFKVRRLLNISIGCKIFVADAYIAYT